MRPLLPFAYCCVQYYAGQKHLSRPHSTVWQNKWACSWHQTRLFTSLIGSNHGDSHVTCLKSLLVLRFVYSCLMFSVNHNSMSYVFNYESPKLPSHCTSTSVIRSQVMVHIAVKSTFASNANRSACDIISLVAIRIVPYVHLIHDSWYLLCIGLHVVHQYICQLVTITFKTAWCLLSSPELPFASQAGKSCTTLFAVADPGSQGRGGTPQMPCMYCNPNTHHVPQSPLIKLCWQLACHV